MGKRSRERRDGDVASVISGGAAGGGLSWLPVVLATGALVLGFVAWTDTKKVKEDLVKRLSDVDQRVIALQKQVANAARPAPPQQQGPDPNKVYTVKVDGAPSKGNATAPIVIAEFSDYQ